MYPFILNPGDSFLVLSPGLVSRIINAIQRFWARDGQSRYTHGGIITDCDGSTFETTRRAGVNCGSLSDYAGKPMLIARHDSIDLNVFLAAFDNIQRHKGDEFPLYRLFFHLFPPLSRIRGFRGAVCSELVAKFFYFAGIFDYWIGVTPDDLSDNFHHWKGFKIVFEGLLPEKEKAS